MAKRAKAWLLPPILLIVVYAVVSLTAKPSYALTVFGDVAQELMALGATAAMLANVNRYRGRASLFWMLMSIGCGFWASSQGLWVYYEVVVRQPMPQPFWGDVISFVHIVPMMGALAVQPHMRQGTRFLRVGILDLCILLLWWMYLYMFLVIPWQYVVRSAVQYGRTYTTLSFIENVAFVVALAIVWRNARLRWKPIYRRLLLAALLYSLSSTLGNIADYAHLYYTGSIYDVPLVISVLGFMWAAVGNPASSAEDEVSPLEEKYAVWPARLAMAAVLSMPVMAMINIAVMPQSIAVRNFRLVLTLGAMLLLGGLVFIKEHFMDQELLRLLQDSRESFANLASLQDQLIQSEKMAALGQLVSGAAHEINNPLAAILGYSDLLSSQHSLPQESRTMAEKIAQQARRTKSLVNNLLSFAKQSKAEKNLLNVDAVVNNAVNLRQTDWSKYKIHVQRLSEGGDQSYILGDSNQIFQVCSHILNNAVDALSESGGGTLTVRTGRENGHVVIEFSDDGPGLKDPQRIFDPFYTTKPVGKGTGLGLSACYGIVQEHQGHIEGYNRPGGGATFVLKFPAAGASLVNAVSPRA